MHLNLMRLLEFYICKFDLKGLLRPNIYLARNYSTINIAEASSFFGLILSCIHWVVTTAQNKARVKNSCFKKQKIEDTV
jgi:hypothetical protein